MQLCRITCLGALALTLLAACGDLPTASISAAETAVPVGAAVQLDGSASVDPDGLPLAFDWFFAQTPPGSTAVLGPTRGARPHFTADEKGTFLVSLVVSNGDDDSEPALLAIEAGACGSNVPAIGALSATPSASDVGAPVQLGAEVTHPDNEPPCDLARALSYHWSLSQTPSGSAATVVPADAAAPSFVPDVAGTYQVMLVVRDDAGGASEPATVEVAVGVCGNNPPVAQADASTTAPAVGQIVELTATIDDPDTAAPCNALDSASYAWTLLSAPSGSEATLHLADGEVASFVPDVPGDYAIRLVATDSTGLASAPADVTVTADVCGSNPPVAMLAQLSPNTAGPDVAVTGADVEVGAIVQLSAMATSDADTADPCNLTQTVSYAWSFLELPLGSFAQLNDATIVNPSFEADEPGDYLLGLVATDSTGRKSDVATFTVNADLALGINVPGGFTVEAIAFGALFDQPRGIARDAGGDIYVVQGGSDRIVQVSGVNVSSFTSSGFLDNPEDIAFDATNNVFFVSDGAGGIAKVTTAGTQMACVSGGNFLGVEIYNGTGGLRLVAADDNSDEIRFYNPATCTLANSNDFDGGSGNVFDSPWGVAAANIGGDRVFATDRGTQEVWRNAGGAYTTDGGTNVLISDSGVIDEPRDIVTTPCVTPKLLVADRGNNQGGDRDGELLLFANSAGASPTIVVTDLEDPVGLLFEDANNLLVTDEQLDALFRITGDFCSL